MQKTTLIYINAIMNHLKYNFIYFILLQCYIQIDVEK